MESVLDANPDMLRRFAAKIELHHECWLWTGAKNSKGYPVFRVNGTLDYAHRVSHKLFLGPIGEGEQVHHKCMNPICVNPAHLESMAAERNRQSQAMGVGEIEDEPPF